MSQKLRRNLFFILVFVAFVAVLIYEGLTPHLSDDIIYYDEVAKAGNIFELFSQEFNQYMTHTGRSVAHIILRLFLFVGPKWIFNVVAAAVFVTLSLLIYVNVYSRSEYDLRLYGFILILLWFGDVAISHTVFWEDGACNYMFTATIMIGFMTLYRLGINGKRELGLPAAFGMFFWGILAGWCNENTSGGVLLFILIEIVAHYFMNGRKYKFLKPWMITGLVGCITGLVLMVIAPGNYGRLAATDEEHTGLLAIVGRFLKITIIIQENYLVLVCSLAAALIILAYCTQGKGKFFESAKSMLLYGFLFFATAYALLAIPSSELRSYYGAFLFMVIALANGFGEVSRLLKEDSAQVIMSSFVAIFGIIFAFSYIGDGANLARIKREFDEREAYFLEMASREEEVIEAPLLRPEWENRFSCAYEMDMREDPEYWINLSYACHYGFRSITGVPRENWEEY